MVTNPSGRIVQGQFSLLPDLTDDEITLQIEHGLREGCAWSVEYTDDPHPRNTCWEMDGMPMPDLNDAAGVRMALQACRKIFPMRSIRLMAFDANRGVETIAMGVMAKRPASGPGFGLVRQEVNGRSLRHTVYIDGTDQPEGGRGGR